MTHPTPGRIVLYRLPDPHGAPVLVAAQEGELAQALERLRPAQVVSVRVDELGAALTLNVAIDAELDRDTVLAGHGAWAQVRGAREGLDVGCWRWPPLVPQAARPPIRTHSLEEVREVLAEILEEALVGGKLAAPAPQVDLEQLRELVTRAEAAAYALDELRKFADAIEAEAGGEPAAGGGGGVGGHGSVVTVEGDLTLHGQPVATGEPEAPTEPPPDPSP